MDGDIYDGDKYEGIAWFCDSCGVLLNKQDGFSDIYGSWTCAECGYNNSITEDDIIDNNDDVAYKIGKTIGQGLVGVVSGILSSAINPNKNELENNNEDETYEDDENEEYNDNNEVNYIVQNEKIENSKENKKRDANVFCICFVSMMLVFVFFYYMAFVPKKGETQITINSKDYIGVNYKEVEEKFREMGFTDIICVPKENLIFGWINKEGETEEISVNGDNKFYKGDIFSKNAKVVINYHSFKNKKWVYK